MPSHLTHESITVIEKPPQIRSPIGIDVPGAQQKETAQAMPGEYKMSKCDLISSKLFA